MTTENMALDNLQLAEERAERAKQAEAGVIGDFAPDTSTEEATSEQDSRV